MSADHTRHKSLPCAPYLDHITSLHFILSNSSQSDFLKLNHQLSFQDDITSTDESCCDESSNDENFLIANQNQQNHQKLPQQPPLIITPQRTFEDDNKQQLFIQTQNQKINEKMLDNQKLLLESLSSLPQNLLQSWIQSGQLQVSVDDGEN